MAKIVDSNLTADGATEAGTIVNPNNGASPYQVVYASGDFGSGTLTVQVSNDGGTTWYSATDSAGAVTLTANGAKRIFLLGSGQNTATKLIKIRCNLASSSSPDLDVMIADCR